jgi:isocitrate lyase
MTDEEMRAFPGELARHGFVFNFITYGGHQIDGLAAEDFTRALQQDGMIALARLQRKFRLVGSPYKTPQALAGGPRLDAALMAASGRTATTKAMGKGSTHHQHLREIEVSPDVLERWLGMAYPERAAGRLRAQLHPVVHSSECVELRIVNAAGDRLAHMVFQPSRDIERRTWLSVVEQAVSDPTLDQAVVGTLMLLFAVKRYQPGTVQYLRPSERQIEGARAMSALGVYANLASVVGQFAIMEVGPGLEELTGSGNAPQFIGGIIAGLLRTETTAGATVAQ